MPDLSEFVGFVVEKSGVRKPSLVEKDILIHRILKGITSSNLGDKYLFKGGSCLVKCYFGYYRFSVDLDFTWIDQSRWNGLGKKRLRRELLKETENFASLLERIAKEAGIDFRNDVSDKNYIEIGGGNRMVTFKLWKNSELVKIQVNFVEKIIFNHEKRIARTLIDENKISEEERIYFDEFIRFYTPVEVLVYSKEEILCEKVRAILTRRAQKLRDFYDVFMLEKHGVNIEELRDDIVEKIRAAMYFQKYRKNIEKNMESLAIEKILDDPLEREMFITRPPVKFDEFMRKFEKVVRRLERRY